MPDTPTPAELARWFEEYRWSLVEDGPTSDRLEQVAAALSRLSQAEQERDELLALHQAIESHCRVETPETRGNPVAHEAEGKALRKRVQEAIEHGRRSRQQRGRG